MTRWLERFAFSFIIIACVLVWEGYRRASGRLGPVSDWQVILYFAGAAGAFAAGVVGIRRRHRNGR